MKTKDVLRRRFGLLTSLVALSYGCSLQEEVDTGAGRTTGADPVERAISELGTAVNGCNNNSASAPSYGYNSTTKVLTLDLTASATVVLSAPSTRITVNGYGCSHGTTLLTTANVSKISINAANGQDNRVIVDTLPGAFGPIFGATGGISVQMADGNDTFSVRGSRGADKFSLAKSSTTSDVYAEFSGDKIADVKVSFTGTLSLIASLGDSADTFNGSPVAADVTAFGALAITTTAATLPLVVYGGAGNDSLRGGKGNDSLYGGDGDDTFTMLSVADGADKYFGDAGIDTVDYTSRGAGVNVDIGPSTAEITGSADLNAALGSLATTTLVFNVDGGADQTVTFTAPTSVRDIADQVNAVLSGVASLGFKPTPHLVLTSKTSTSTSSVQIKSGTGLTNLGFTAGTYNADDGDDGLPLENDDVRNSVENISGSAYADTLIGSAGRNVIKAGAGDDHILGGTTSAPTRTSEADDLRGEDGNDSFYVPQVNVFAVLSGGNGTDTVTYAYRSGNLTAALDGTPNSGEANENQTLALDVENLHGGDGIDILTGNSSPNTIWGGKSDDILSGGAGNDVLIGGPGADKLNGGNGPEDVADYSDAPSAINISLCVDDAYITGDPFNCSAGSNNDGESVPGADVVANVEILQGSAFADTLTCGSNGCSLEGNDGNDTLNGGPGSDHLWGGNGNDSLFGLDGNDTIDGNTGNDLIEGGPGDDICFTDGSDLVAALDCEG